jgi:hypothetical protein
MSRWGNRVCGACHEDLPRREYSTNQWGKVAGESRCYECVDAGRQVSAADTFTYGRRQNALWWA